MPDSADKPAEAASGAGGVPSDGAAPPPGQAAPATPRERLASAAWVAAGALSALGLLYLLAPVLTPFALAGVLAYLLLPGANWMHGHGVPRALAALVMVLAFGAAASGLVLILLPVLEREAIDLNRELPAVIGQLNSRLVPAIDQWLGVSIRFDASALRAFALEHVGQQDIATALLAKFGTGGLALLGFLAALMLVPVVLFYLLLDAQHFSQRFAGAIPPRWRERTMGVLGEIDAVLAQFLRGQLTVMLLMAIYYSGALAIAGFESALPIGVLTGLLIFIPYVGYALGLVLATLTALLQFSAWQGLLSILLIYGFGEVLEGFVLTPRLVGQRIGLHPLAVIFALLAFGQVFGFLGVLVALPASAVLLVALRRVRAYYLASAFYNRP